MKRIFLISLTVIAILILGVIVAAPSLEALAGYYYPSFYITAVVRDQTVAVQTYNLTADTKFSVRMGPYGGLGLGGYYVTSFDSGSGGSKSLEFTIPSELSGSQRIAIRMDGDNGYYAYNWFWNNTYPGSAPVPTSVPGTPKPPGYTGYPYFYISTVKQNDSVSILPYNFPPNDKFTVTMNLYGTLGYNGTVVTTVTSDSKGKLSSTSFDIPSGLKDEDRIAIRLQSANSGYYAYNWFWNSNAP